MRGRWLLIVAGVIVVALVVTFWEVYGRFPADGKKEDAISQQMLFLMACRAYRNSHEHGTYPVNLSELVAPTNGWKPLIDGGKAALLDPWYKPYCYAIGDTPAGQVVYVWCAHEENGKLCGFGCRMQPDGTIRRFTISDD